MSPNNPDHSLMSGVAASLDKHNDPIRPPGRSRFRTTDKIRAVLRLSNQTARSSRFRTLLYRFLTDNVPVINACIATWVRLSAAPGAYRVIDSRKKSDEERASERLELLSGHLVTGASGNPPGLVTFLSELFTGLYRDGLFAGFLTVHRDGSGVDRFLPISATNLSWQEHRGRYRLMLAHDQGETSLDRPDFYHIPLNGSGSEPLGR